jgi:hypothetical protein
MTPSPPNALLRWFPDRGLELDLRIVLDRVTITMMGVPIPVDGTKALRAGLIEMDSLEILFKSEVDIEDLSGHLLSASVQLVESEMGDLLSFRATAEELRGDLRRIAVQIPVTLPPGVPEEAGPQPQTEPVDELNWADDKVLARLLSDMFQPEAKNPYNEKAWWGTGLDTLLKTLGIASPDLEQENKPKPKKRKKKNDKVEQIAMGLLDFLVERRKLVLDQGVLIGELVDGAAPHLDPNKTARNRAKGFSRWLLKQPGVFELSISDSELAMLIDMW